MDFSLIKSGLQQGTEAIGSTSKKAFDYLKSDEFKNKIKEGFNATKEKLEEVYNKIKESDATKKVGQKSKEVIESLENSQIGKSFIEKKNNIITSIRNNNTLISVSESISQKVRNLRTCQDNPNQEQNQQSNNNTEDSDESRSLFK